MNFSISELAVLIPESSTSSKNVVEESPLWNILVCIRRSLSDRGHIFLSRLYVSLSKLQFNSLYFPWALDTHRKLRSITMLHRVTNAFDNMLQCKMLSKVLVLVEYEPKCCIFV